MTPDPGFTIRRLLPTDAAPYRTLRLQALRDHPESFGASLHEEEAHPLPWFQDRLRQNTVFGGWRDASILGCAGLMIPATSKKKHKGVLWGMYVVPQARASGLAAALVAKVIEEAARTVEDLTLSVITTNLAATRLYSRAGFTPYGVEPRALKIGDQYYDDCLMTRSLRKTA